MGRKRYSFWIDDAQADGLKRIKERDGAPESEQIRRALDDWLKKKEAGNRRAGTRRKP